MNSERGLDMLFLLYVACFITCLGSSLEAAIPRNLFEAYDVLIMGFRPPYCRAQFGVGYEGAFSTKAFLGDDDSGMAMNCDSCVNVLQLWQKEQDAIAALKGFPADHPASQLGQQLFREDDNTTHGLDVPYPTGKGANPDRLLGMPLGNDGGIGMHVSGLLELCYRHGIILGIDAELLHLFGTNGCYRVKTNPNQTDLFLLKKINAYREPGFTQEFTLFAEKVQVGGGFAGTLAYQYYKHSEDVLYPCSPDIDPIVVNNAESLQEWTAHSFVFLLGYDWAYKSPCWDVIPSCSFFCKVGFNGKRAILANTVGATFNIAF